MFTSITAFEKSFGQEMQNTGKVLANLTDESLNQRVADGFRTLGEIAWHLVTTYPEMMKHTGLVVGSLAEDAPRPGSAAEIKAAYEKVSKECLDQIVSKWDDATLMVEDDMYGMKWPKGLTLSILIYHEIHHRGQMTVLMRQAGLKVPGVCGPSKEEWAQFGKEPQP